MDNQIVVSLLSSDSKLVELMDKYFKNDGMIIYKECGVILKRNNYIKTWTGNCLLLRRCLLSGSIGIKAYYVDSNGKKYMDLLQLVIWEIKMT